MSNDQYGFIRNALRANACFSVIGGLPLIIVPGAIASWVGVAGPVWVLPSLGVSLLGFAAFVWWVSSGEQLSIKLVNTVSAMDIVWVLATAEILLFDLISFSAAGRMLIIVVALFVALFATAQITGVLRFKRARLNENAPAL